MWAKSELFHAFGLLHSYPKPHNLIFFFRTAMSWKFIFYVQKEHHPLSKCKIYMWFFFMINTSDKQEGKIEPYLITLLEIIQGV